ncbi:hypothetical protein RXV86_02625 [Alisedimentitalea sp. MJ-SS2]|uniref:NADase-type glycan-binding domain-containing protein n=1 Tax=Aliisedimentitalea sp. MJ-SS2 TaxID=3049795 RepID=UPI002906047E|nr:hypothetical protein [Alisedimentitalea sp. MJ-SS2]MDU8926270.1 hypothetical protein [Alisedimentitalea sp. MJ-SS2]
MRMTKALALAAFLIAAAPVARAEICAYLGATENFNQIDYCVSSMLTSQGSSTYGPDNLFDFSDASAWCEGVRGPGIGELVSLRIDNGGPFRRFLIENGYGKSSDTFTRNARPRTIEIRTNTGVRFRHVLEDTSFEQMVFLPRPDTYETLQIRVIDAYPGTLYQDLCISTILVDFDYEKYLEYKEDTVPSAAAPPTVDHNSSPDPTLPAPAIEDLPALPSL